MHTYASLTSRQSSGKSSTGGKRPLTNPIMSRRMEHIYQIGRLKAITRQDKDVNERDFSAQAESCTFQPTISQASQELSE